VTPKSNFSIYRSSAGSGKTYQLALEFIALVLVDPSLYNKILAVTFTNKATKEMKERILDFLIDLSLNRNDPLLDQLMEKTQLDQKLIVKHAKEIVGKILHQYSQFSVSTIDSFFQKIVKSFARELGLLGNFKVELDQDKVKQEIIDQVIDELGVDKEITNWLVDFSFSKVEDNQSWDIRPQIEILASEIFKESFRKPSKTLSEISRDDLIKYRKEIQGIKSDFEQKMKSEALHANELIEKHGLSVDDFSRKKSGPAGYFNRIIIKGEYDPKKLVREVCGSPDKWSTKTSSKKNEIQQVVESGLQQITQHLVDYYDKHFVDYATANEAMKNIYVFGILSQITAKLKDYRLEHDLMMISDVPMFLNGIISENEAPFVYEKTGTWFEHYLIDEFQDTSNFQWKNFKPLIENGLALGRNSLLVGDGKQSIYRWRGGDWNLILNKVSRELQAYNPEDIKLQTNWRSSANIVRVNNAFFKIFPVAIRADLSDKIESAEFPDDKKQQLLDKVIDVESLYDDANQEIAEKHKHETTGRIDINIFQKTEDISWKENSLKAMYSSIELLQENGFQPRDIAILVRKGDEGRKVIEGLLNHKNSEGANSATSYEAVSNESLYLKNSSAVRLIVNTISYCLNTEDKIALSEVAYNYKYVHFDQPDESDQNDLFYILDQKILPENFDEFCLNLTLLPAYEMVERIIQFYGINQTRHQGYLQAFQDLLLDYFSGDKKDINDFLEWWKEKGCRKSIQIPDDVNAMQVLTIHKSKGLEFRAVLVPFCDWKLDHDATKGNFLWCKSNEKPYSEIGYLPLKYSKALANTHYAGEYFSEMINAHIDNLNLVYVALTRAERYLMVNCPPKNQNLSGVGDMINHGIMKMLEEDSKEIEIVEKNNEDFDNYSIGHDDKSTSKEVLETIEKSTTGYQTSNWRHKIAIRKKGGVFFTKEGFEKKAKINYGLLVHEILASITNENHMGSSIEKYFLEGQISSDDKIVLKDQLEKIFAIPIVRDWFNTDWQVKAEAQIIMNDGHSKRPDRVLLNGQQAVIIDFKTGIEKAADKRQILSYKQVLIEMGFDDIQCYLLYIKDNKVTKVA